MGLAKTPKAVLAWSEVYLTNKTMLDKIFPMDSDKLFDALKGMVEKERMKMEPEEWVKCLTNEIRNEFKQAQFSPSKLPASAKKVGHIFIIKFQDLQSLVITTCRG